MSADNGIYILWTPGLYDTTEFRVAHLAAIDNLDWDESTRELTTNDDVRMKNAREMWGGAKMFTSRVEALDYAADMLEDYPICEYGISFIHIPRHFTDAAIKVGGTA